MPMTPLQSWAMILLLILGSIALARLFTASKEEWRELFFPSKINEGEATDD